MEKILAWVILIYSVILITHRPENFLGIRDLFAFEEFEYAGVIGIITTFMIINGYYLLFRAKKIKNIKKINKNQNDWKIKV